MSESARDAGKVCPATADTIASVLTEAAAGRAVPPAAAQPMDADTQTLLATMNSRDDGLRRFCQGAASRPGQCSAAPEYHLLV